MSEFRQTPEQAHGRPEVTAEQQQAFRRAHAQLMRKAKETDSPVQLMINDEGFTETAMTSASLDRDEGFHPNAIGSHVFVSAGEQDDLFAWVYAHDEELTHQTETVGSFTLSTDPSSTEQDIYTFHSDGNVGHSRWDMGYENDPAGVTTFMDWLNPQETDDLALVIEQSRFESS